jgi:hypothetical protein
VQTRTIYKTTNICALSLEFSVSSWPDNINKEIEKTNTTEIDKTIKKRTYLNEMKKIKT